MVVIEEREERETVRGMMTNRSDRGTHRYGQTNIGRTGNWRTGT